MQQLDICAILQDQALGRVMYAPERLRKVCAKDGLTAEDIILQGMMTKAVVAQECRVKTVPFINFNALREYLEALRVVVEEWPA